MTVEVVLYGLVYLVWVVAPVVLVALLVRERLRARRIGRLHDLPGSGPLVPLDLAEARRRRAARSRSEAWW